MKRLKFLLIPLLLCAMAASDPAWAERAHHGGRHGSHQHSHPGYPGHPHFRGHTHLGVFIAAPLFYPWYSPAIPYYPPPPAVYVERGDPVSAPGGYWYRCDNPPGYYPYVRACPGGWRKLLPAPAPY